MRKAEFLHRGVIKKRAMLFLSTSRRHTGKEEVRLHSFLASALCGDK